MINAIGRPRLFTIVLTITAVLGFGFEANAKTPDWIVETDSMDGAFADMEQMIDDAGVPAVIRGISLDVTSRSATEDSFSRRKNYIHTWQAQIVSELEYKGFEIISNEDVASAIGQSGKDLQSIMIDAMPFGMREDIRKSTSEKVYFLVSTLQPTCVSGDGAMLAMVIGNYPRQGVGSSYGGVALMMYGLGSCGDRAGERFAERTLEFIKDDFMKDRGVQP